MRRGAVKGLVQFQRQRLREIRKANRERLDAADQLVRQLRQESDLIVRAYRIMNGEKLRTRRQGVPEQIMDDSAETYSAELRELVERAQHGDETAMPELRELLNGTPELWRQLGDLAWHVETSWIKLLASNDLLTQESLRREAERRRTELLGDDPTAIEVHLVERITATWLQLQHAEIQMGKSDAATDQQLNFRHKRLESAQKQHAAAINQLSRIRKEAKATRGTSGKKTQQSGRDQRSRKRVQNRVVAASPSSDSV